MHRDIYTDFRINDLEQGAIFYGAKSDNYIDKEVYGIIITPRCDISNGKVNYFNYLPVIPFQDFLINDYWIIFRQQVLSMLNNNLKSSLQNKKLSESIVEKFDILFIKEKYEKYFTKASEQKKFKELTENISNINSTQTNIITPKDLNCLMLRHEKQAKGILTEINNNRNPNFHLVESWAKEGEYYVILLREIKRITYNLGMNLSKGIEVEGLTSIEKNNNDINKSIELLYIEKVLKSPFLEHLIQRFTSNFDKIGVEDHFSNLTNHLFKSYTKVL